MTSFAGSGGGSPLAPRPLRWFIVHSIVVVLVATLTPLESRNVGPEIRCLLCSVPSLADSVLNLGLFLPFGFALGLNGYPTRRSLVFGGLLSVGVEVAQIWVPGRDSSVSDVVFNTLGAVVGSALAHSTSFWLTPPPQLAQRLAVSAALVATIIVATTGILLEPSFPFTRYFGGWTHEFGHLERYRGRLLGASIGGLKIPAGPISYGAEVRRRLLAEAPLHLSLLAGSPTPGLAPLLSLHDEKSVEILLLGADRDDLVLRFRMRAAVAGLDSPSLRVRGALRRFSPGELLEITVSPDHNARCIEVNRESTCGLGFTAGIGWAFLFFGQNIPWAFHPLLNVAWMAAVWFPSGFWARGRRESLVAAALLLGGLLLLPAPTGLLNTPVGEIGAAVAGLLTGRGLGSLQAAKTRIVVTHLPQWES